MLNQVLKMSPGTYRQFIADAVKIVNIFWIFEFHTVVYQHITDEVEILCYVHVLTNQLVQHLKIGPHLPKLLSNIKGLTSLETKCIDYYNEIQ